MNNNLISGNLYLNKSHYSLKEIIINNETIAKVHRGELKRDDFLELLYRDESINRKVKGYLINLGVDKNTVQTIFNLTLIKLIKTVVKNKNFKINSSLENYLCGIARLTYYEELRLNDSKEEGAATFESDMHEEYTPETLVIDHEKTSLIHQVLDRIGKKCKEVLMHWGNGFKMADIAKLAGYASEGMAKKKKHQCMKALLLYLEQNPELKNILR